MNTFSHLSPFLAVISGSLFSGTALCNDIVLPPPDKKGGKPLMQVLHERHSTRSFADKPIPVEVLSSLLWAAQGVNRDDPDYRTAPSSRNSNEIEIYVSSCRRAPIFTSRKPTGWRKWYRATCGPLREHRNSRLPRR